MAAELFVPPSKALDANANPYAGAKWFFYATGTTTPQSVYTTSALSVTHANPVVADSSGKFANIFFDPALSYRGVLKDSTGAVTLYDIDPVNSGIISQLSASAGAALIGFSHANTYAPGTVGNSAKRIINVTDAPFNCVGDGTDEYAEITAVCAALDAANGGIMVFPVTAAGGVFGLSETIQIPENVTVAFTGGSVKILGTTTYDAAFIGIPGATNVEIQNPQIDCNNIPAACGIIMRRNNAEFRVIGGLIKNCVHDTTRKGGRAINIEAGMNLTEYGSRNAVVMGTIARDCYEALSISGGATTQQESNIRVDMVAENCQGAISFFGNTAGYPHGPDEMGCHITMTARNCGKATTYARVHGVINADRACNAKIDIQVMNDATYGAIGSLWRGDASNVVLNAQMTGECSRALLDFASYQEANSIDEDATWTGSGNAFSSMDSVFNVKHTGTIADTVNLPIASAAFLTNCQFDLTTDVVSTLKPVNTNMANKTNCFGRFQNKTSNAIIQGYFSEIGSAVTFANCANLSYNMGKGNVRARGSFTGSTGAGLDLHMATVSRVSTGIYDVTFTTAMPNVNYFVDVNATQSSTSTVQYREAYSLTTSGFRIETRNNNTLVDPTVVTFSVVY